MTEDSQESVRGYGPFEEGAEPTAPTTAQPASTPPTAPITTRPAGTPDARAGVEPAAVDSSGGDAYPASAPPYSAPPGAEMDPYGDAAPTSASPYGASPTSPAPGPYGADPVGGGSYSYGPFHTGRASPGWGAPGASDPYGLPQTGRRIEPSPPPEPRRLLVGILAGLFAGFLLFGTGGWFLGHVTAPAAEPVAVPSAGLGVFEQSQVAINRPNFAGTGLERMAQGWLPYLSGCVRSGRPGGPRLGSGEKVRVRCTLNGMGANFVEYTSVAERDKGRAGTLEQSDDARTLTPGAAAVTKRATPSQRVSGDYVEYAYKVDDGGTDRIVSGIWWDDAQTPIAGYLLAFWKEGLGERWEPMRDLWSRYA